MSGMVLKLKNMDVRMYRPKQLPYHFLLLYDLPSAWRAMYIDAMNGSSEDNALLTYCYLDSQCGLSCYGICCARLYDSGRVEFNYSDTKSYMLTIRESSLESKGEIINEDEPGMEEFRKEAEKIKRNYGYFRERVVKHPDIPFDAFRHPAFQEHIMTYFVSPFGEKEIIWTNEEKRIDGNHVVASLLDEPYSRNMGRHKGEEIVIASFDPGVGENVPTAVLPWMVEGMDG